MEPAIIFGLSFVTGFSVVCLVMLGIIKNKEIKNLRSLLFVKERRIDYITNTVGEARLYASGVLKKSIKHGEANPTVWYDVMKHLHNIPGVRKDTSLDEKYEQMLEQYCSDEKEEANAQ